MCRLASSVCVFAVAFLVVTITQAKTVDNDETIQNDQASLLKTLRRQRRQDGWALYPGTKWCGAGHSASSYDDLGEHVQTDMCCRDHDHCPQNIESLSNEYCYTNIRLYTISHCDCDAQFRACLNAVNNFVSDAVGHAYFTILSPPCFTLQTETVCEARSWWSCTRYVDQECVDEIIDQSSY